MPDLFIRHRIPQANRAAAVSSFLRVYPNITSDPQQWSDPALTDAEWMRHRIRQWINDTIHEGRRGKHREDNPPPDAAEYVEAE